MAVCWFVCVVRGNGGWRDENGWPGAACVKGGAW